MLCFPPMETTSGLQRVVKIISKSTLESGHLITSTTETTRRSYVLATDAPSLFILSIYYRFGQLGDHRFDSAMGAPISRQSGLYFLPTRPPTSSLEPRLQSRMTACGSSSIKPYHSGYELRCCRKRSGQPRFCGALDRLQAKEHLSSTTVGASSRKIRQRITAPCPAIRCGWPYTVKPGRLRRQTRSSKFKF